MFNIGPYELLVLVAATALACAYVAGRRGRSKPAWFVVGLVAPVLGLLLLIALTTDDRSRQHTG